MPSHPLRTIHPPRSRGGPTSSWSAQVRQRQLPGAGRLSPRPPWPRPRFRRSRQRLWVPLGRRAAAVARGFAPSAPPPGQLPRPAARRSAPQSCLQEAPGCGGGLAPRLRDPSVPAPRSSGCRRGAVPRAPPPARAAPRSPRRVAKARAYPGDGAANRRGRNAAPLLAEGIRTAPGPRQAGCCGVPQVPWPGRAPESCAAARSALPQRSSEKGAIFFFHPFFFFF